MQCAMQLQKKNANDEKKEKENKSMTKLLETMKNEQNKTKLTR